MKLIEIFDGNPFHAQMVKNLLENEGIESFLKDEIIARSPIFRPDGGVGRKYRSKVYNFFSEYARQKNITLVK